MSQVGRKNVAGFCVVVGKKQNWAIADGVASLGKPINQRLASSLCQNSTKVFYYPPIPICYRIAV